MSPPAAAPELQRPVRTKPFRFPREGEQTIATVLLFDERSDPGFGELYARYVSDAEELDAAVSRVRLGGIRLGEQELGGLRRLRLLVGEMNALAVSCEVEALAANPDRRARLAFITRLLREGRLEVRVAPLAGWSPDFSIFRNSSTGPAAGGSEPTVMIGPHWFERPYPHPGPALGVLLQGAGGLKAARRFEEVWSQGHDLRRPLLGMLREGLRRTACPDVSRAMSAG